MTLDPASIDAVARRVVELLREETTRRTGGTDLISPAEVAQMLGVSRDYVYRHHAELGAVRVGAGSRPRLRFDPAVVTERLAGESQSHTPQRSPSRRRRPRQEHDLLPIRGEAP